MKLSTRIIFITTLFVLAACGSPGSSSSDDAGRNLHSKQGIIFESDFSEDLGYFATNLSLIDSVNVPNGWDGVKVTENGSFEVLLDIAVSPKPVLKIAWDPDKAQPTVRLFKHLTGDMNTGYDELYIRYKIRLPDNFRAGDGDSLAHWKWGRLWQNTAPTNPGAGQPGAWTENRADSFYIVWNFNNSPPFTNVNAVWGANTGVNLAGGSNSGERYRVDHYIPGAIPEFQDAYFEHMGNGAWDFITIAENPAEAGFLKNRNQGWHTIEYHFKLASSAGANDGVQEVWFDGVLQNANGAGSPGWTRIRERGGAPPISGLPTARHGSGLNMFVFFDNMQKWNSDWGNPNVDGFIYVADVIVSTNRIGHEYLVDPF